MPSSLDLLFDFLRFESVSTDPARAGRVAACADWLAALLKERGFSAEVHPTPGHPVVLARNAHRPGRKTVLVYGHYDVQPEDPVDLWQSAPFDPVIRDGKIFARGATDNKGQMFAHLMGAADMLAERGDLPVNLILLFEGEEEIGSPHLAPFLEAHRDKLACDVIAVSDTGMLAPGYGTMTYGLRGIACLELIVRGPATDLHSGIFGGAVLNPIAALARILDGLHGPDWTVTAPGFLDQIAPLQQWERDMWASLPWTEEDTRALTGAPSLAGEAGFTECERRWARPTVEINGIGGGYQGTGSKTVIPAQAFAKLSCRLVPGQTPDHTLACLEKRLRALTPAGVTAEIVPGHSGQPYLMDPKGPLGTAARRALHKTFPDHEPLLIREGGSIPIINDFEKILGVDTLLLGLALPDCQIHAPNENFPVENFQAGQRLHRFLLEEIAAL